MCCVLRLRLVCVFVSAIARSRARLISRVQACASNAVVKRCVCLFTCLRVFCCCACLFAQLWVCILAHVHVFDILSVFVFVLSVHECLLVCVFVCLCMFVERVCLFV